MTSTRLPGKVMLPLCGKTVLEIMIERLNNYNDNIIIATTNDGTEELIVDTCKKHNLKYYRGDTEDVLGRYYQAAIEFGAKAGDTIVRITSDCPLIDQNILKQNLKLFSDKNLDLCGCGPHSGFPRGFDNIAFKFEVLEECFLNAKDSYEREHVLPYTNKINNLKIDNYNSTHDYSYYRLTLDEQKDYLAIKEIYNKFSCDTSFNYDELLSVLKENKYIYELNAHVKQKNK